MQEHLETQQATETQHPPTVVEGQADEGSTPSGEASPSGDPSGAVQWEQLANDLWAETAQFAERMRTAMKKPAIGAAVAGGAVLAAGALWGASEAAVAVLGAYVAYRVLRKKDRPQKSEPSS